MIESIPHSIAGTFHLHVEFDDEYVSQSADSTIGLDITPSEQGLESGIPNENLSEDVSNSELDSFISGTTNDISSSDVVQEHIKDQPNSLKPWKGK